MTPEEFLAFERASDEKHEYRDGVIVAMSGARRSHNLISVNLGARLWECLKDKQCEAYISDMRVYVPQSKLYTYPDIAVVCGEPEFRDGVFDTLLNPTLIIEILSETTESYDRGQKFEYYRRIDSLQEYVLISQTRPYAEKFNKHGDGFWMLTEVSGIDAEFPLDSIDCALKFADAYTKVNFPDG